MDRNTKKRRAIAASVGVFVLIASEVFHYIGLGYWPGFLVALIVLVIVLAIFLKR